MRSVFRYIRRAGGLLTMFAVLIAPTAMADEMSFLMWLEARIGNPGG